MAEINVMSIVMVSVVGVIIIVLIPTFFIELLKMFVIGSAEAVSKDMAGLTTISAAAPHTITFDYYPASEVASYKVAISGHDIDVEMLDAEGNVLESATSLSAPSLPATNIEGKAFRVKKYRVVTSGVPSNRYEVRTT